MCITTKFKVHPVASVWYLFFAFAFNAASLCVLHLLFIWLCNRLVHLFASSSGDVGYLYLTCTVCMCMCVCMHVHVCVCVCVTRMKVHVQDDYGQYSVSVVPFWLRLMIFSLPFPIRSPLSASQFLKFPTSHLLAQSLLQHHTPVDRKVVPLPIIIVLLNT